MILVLKTHHWILLWFVFQFLTRCLLSFSISLSLSLSQLFNFYAFGRKKFPSMKFFITRLIPFHLLNCLFHRLWRTLTFYLEMSHFIEFPRHPRQKNYLDWKTENLRDSVHVRYSLFSVFHFLVVHFVIIKNLNPNIQKGVVYEI